jgi:transcriptional regulator GlxA family with amidase domain
MRPSTTILTILTLALLFIPAILCAAQLVPPANRPIRVAVVLTDGATMIDFAGPWEVFQDVMLPGEGSAEPTTPFELFTVGAAKEPIRTSGGMAVVPDYTFADAPVPDVIVIGAQRGAPDLGPWLRKMRPQSRIIMSVCTGAFKLADAGLLDGKPATTHHDFFDAFAKRFPKVTLVRDKRFVQADSVVYSAGGLTSGIDLALHVVSLYFGKETAERTAVYMEYTGTRWRESS